MTKYSPRPSIVTIDGRGEYIVTEGISTVFLYFIYRPWSPKKVKCIVNDQNNRLYSPAKQWPKSAALSSPIKNEAGEFVCTKRVKGACPSVSL